MPDLNYLLGKLINGTWIYVNVTSPRNLVLNNNSYLVTVERNKLKVDRFIADNLTLTNRISIPNNTNSNVMAVALSNNAYFAGLSNGTIVVIDSRNLSVLYNISSSYIQFLRGIIFLNNGRTMVITNLNDNLINVFYQANNSSLNYVFAYQQSVNYSQPHGLTVYNDSLFYAVSCTSNSVYSYSAVPNSTLWIERLVIDGSSIGNSSSGTFITIDDCGRYWFSLGTPVIQIFDSLGHWIGNFSLGTGMIFDILISNNYVMYFSDRDSSWSRIVRIDPHIQC
jgi:hypothetical protein